jgi:lipopolysaccharide/colanic/teichoic acid biosynthesis glycosyltransferase
MAVYRGKRALDLVLTVPALTLSLPVQALVALLVRRRLGSPVIFRQQRPGLDGRPFELRKFRTMRPFAPELGWNDDTSRLTPFGRCLRATSLDELPTLWNVVRGEMSLVGPRPLLMQYLERYTPEQARRHDVRPGLTGLAQVSGRNALTWEQKFDLDLEYVQRQSLALDLRIIGRTITSVLRREGISGHGESTMPEFMGSGPRREEPTA